MLNESTISQDDQEAILKLKRDLKRTRALLKDAQSQLEKARSEASSKVQIRQLKNQVSELGVGILPQTERCACGLYWSGGVLRGRSVLVRLPTVRAIEKPCGSVLFFFLRVGAISPRQHCGTGVPVAGFYSRCTESGMTSGLHTAYSKIMIMRISARC